ncbi:hypothetical protein BDZ89DRAFT_1067942, partial [Hymenopellis radicata]
RFLLYKMGMVNALAQTDSLSTYLSKSSSFFCLRFGDRATDKPTIVHDVDPSELVVFLPRRALLRL